jgi:glucose/arabinose dehydrogenase
MRSRAGRVPSSVVFVSIAVAACGRESPRPAARTAASAGEVASSRALAVACSPENGGITLPAGFCASIFYDEAGSARDVAVAANGDVFVDRQGGRGVLALRDTNGDGRADVHETFGRGGGTGIAVVPGWVYVDEGNRIARYPLPAGHLTPSGDAQVVVSDLPTGGHPARNFVLDGKGDLFVNVGSESNSCQENDRQPRSPGHDPCRELETRAGIWRFRADRQNQRFTPAARYATGLRNGMAMAMNPADGAIYAGTHGRDGLGHEWGFSDERNAELPSEEVVRIEQGTDAGWPYCYYDQIQKKLVLAPEYGGDGSKVGRCAGKAQPVVAFPGHWAPMSALFYTGRQFPARYRDGMFIAFHGSWNRLPLPQQGFRVDFAPMSGNRFTGAYETFAGDFAGHEVTGPPGAAAHRPVGLAQSPDGAVYVTDDRAGRIWKIVYTGK